MGLRPPQASRLWPSFALFHIGKLAYLQNDLDRALTCLTDALHQTRMAPPNETAVYSAVYLATVHARRGAFPEAARALSDCDRMLTEIESGIERFPLDIVAVLAASTRPVDAVRLFGADAAHADRTGHEHSRTSRWSRTPRSPCANSSANSSIKRRFRLAGNSVPMTDWR